MKTKEPLSPEALRKKELHYRSMVWTGFFMTACGLAAAYLAFTRGPVPSLFFGRLRAAAAPAQGRTRKAKTTLVGWRPWGKAALDEARASGKLVLLNVCVSYNRACAVMDETTYADPRVAEAVDKFITVRVDADQRPDIAARYQSGGWPSTALMTPDGRPLGRATFLTPELFLPWAKSIGEAYEKRKGQPLPEDAKDDEVSPPGDPQAELAAAWDGPGARFPRFDWLAALKGMPWASALVARESQAALALQDPVWGGFFRCADGPGWSNPETEKLLVDQAQAILARTAVLPTLAYVDRFLTDANGGYYASQSCELRKGEEVIEGRYLYSLKDRPGIPPVDKRLFAEPNFLMARAGLSAGGAASARRALRALDLFWRGARGGLVPHQLGAPSPRGLLLDEAALGRALLAAYDATKDPKWLERAKAAARAMDAALLDPATGAYFDRPATGELPPALDRLLLPSQNFEAFLFLSGLPGVYPERLKAWLRAHSGRLDPVARASLPLRP